MKIKGMSKMNLFFLECIVSIVMFSLASVVMIQAFTKVEQTRIRSKDEMQALVIMCTIAEHIQSEQPELPEQMSWYYNDQGELLEGGEEPRFEVEIVKTNEFYEAGTLEKYRLKTYRIRQSEKEVLGEFQFAGYRPEKMSQEEGGEQSED